MKFSSVKGVSIKTESSSRGFTLVEMIVAVGLFMAVMMVAMTSLLSILDANRKAQTLSSVINNLNFAIDDMSRNMRVGTTYHCGLSGVITVPADCPSGESYIGFEAYGGNSATADDQVVYRLSGTQLQRSDNGGSTFIGVTAPEVILTNVRFYVDGAVKGDNEQPRVLIIVDGYAEINQRSRSNFNIQTLATQRLYDL